MTPTPIDPAPDDAGCRGGRCVTCADEAIEMRVVEPAGGGLARCAVDRGADAPEREIETALVGAVAAGDRLLVHAGVALARLEGTP